MNSEIGMVKGGPGPAERTSPTANTARADPKQQAEERQKTPAEALAEAAKAKQVAEEVVTGLNELVQDLHRELQFSVDEESGETIIKVIDRETDEVVRQIPSEEVVRLRRRLQEAAGVIFQDSA